MPQATLTISSNNIVQPVGGLSIANLFVVAPTPITASGTLTFSGAGTQSVTVPTGMTWVIVVPNFSSGTLTFKGSNAADTGVPISTTQAGVYTLGSTATALNFTSTAAGTLSYAFT